MNNKTSYDIVENKKLELNQINAIVNGSANNLVLASAGCGKTTTILGKIKYLLLNKEVDPKEILILSFTKMSAEELKTRVFNETNIELDIMTFHKLSLQIVRYFENKDVLSDNNFCITKIIYELLKNKKFYDSFIKYKYDTNYLKDFHYNLFKVEKHNLVVETTVYLSQLISKVSTQQINILDIENKSYKYQRFKEVFIPVIAEYEKYKINNNCIDFNDMITSATKYVETKKYKIDYKYIIIDEYQDMSEARLQLINGIKSIHDAKLFCVGDDYQAIFSYAGSKLKFLTNFEDYFGEYQLHIIENTYRFNQSLVDISNTFILQNKKQIRKNIKSKKDNDLKSLQIIYSENIILDIENILNTLPSYSKVFLLGRYQHDIKIIEKSNRFIIDNQKVFFMGKADLDISFLTIHQSKGLEADYVFIINNKNGKNGFPSNKKDNYINKVIFNQQDFYNEERRLFYVAITRTKKITYLLADKKNQSTFIKEIKKRK